MMTMYSSGWHDGDATHLVDILSIHSDMTTLLMHRAPQLIANPAPNLLCLHHITQSRVQYRESVIEEEEVNRVSPKGLRREETLPCAPSCSSVCRVEYIAFKSPEVLIARYSLAMAKVG